MTKKQTEADKELQRMFGHKQEQGLSIIDRQKISIVQKAYKNAPIFFKMFFDKVYRPDRYNAMTSQIDKFKNINEFRTQMNQNYSFFPVEAADNIFFVYTKPKNEVALMPQDDKRDDNVLLERAYLKTCWHVIRC